MRGDLHIDWVRDKLEFPTLDHLIKGCPWNDHEG